jgi:hypothetical protein
MLLSPKCSVLSTVAKQQLRPSGSGLTPPMFKIFNFSDVDNLVLVCSSSQMLLDLLQEMKVSVVLFLESFF